MSSNRFISFVFLFFFFNGTSVFSKEKTPSRDEIAKELKSAIHLMREGKHDQSLIKCRRILRHAIFIKDNDLIASTYNTIGGNFDLFSNPEKSFFYYNKGLIYADKTNDSKLKNLLHNNLGNIYCFDKKEYQKGIAHYKKSLEYSAKANDSSQLVLTNLNIAWAYFDIQEFNQGYPYLQFVNKYQEKYGSGMTIVALNMLNALYYADKKANPKAEFYFNKAIQLGNAGSEKFDLALTHQEYAEFLKSNGQYQKAYENLTLYNSITDELDNEEQLNKAKTEGLNLEIEEYKREVERIESEYKTQQEILQQEKTMARRKFIAVISIFLISIVLFYFYVQNSRLIQKNRLNGLRNKIQQNIINASLSGQEIERKKIAAFLHDNISALLSSAGLHLSVFNTKNQNPSDEIIKTIALLGEAHDKVRDLSHELIPALLVRFGLLYALEDLCEKNSNSTITFEFESNIDNQKRYPEDFEIKIYFIITELLNNIIKHSQATIGKVTLTENDTVLKIQVFDNGKGFDTNQFQLLEGFGINQIRARINAMKGNLTIDSKIDMVTIITVDVPISKT
jgi:two-component system, NarL family, sensor kinase